MGGVATRPRRVRFPSASAIYKTAAGAKTYSHQLADRYKTAAGADHRAPGVRFGRGTFSPSSALLVILVCHGQAAFGRRVGSDVGSDLGRDHLLKRLNPM